MDISVEFLTRAGLEAVELEARYEHEAMAILEGMAGRRNDALTARSAAEILDQLVFLKLKGDDGSRRSRHVDNITLGLVAPGNDPLNGNGITWTFIDRHDLRLSGPAPAGHDELRVANELAMAIVRLAPSLTPLDTRLAAGLHLDLITRVDIDRPGYDIFISYGANKIALTRQNTRPNRVEAEEVERIYPILAQAARANGDAPEMDYVPEYKIISPYAVNSTKRLLDRISWDSQTGNSLSNGP